MDALLWLRALAWLLGIGLVLVGVAGLALSYDRPFSPGGGPLVRLGLADPRTESTVGLVALGATLAGAVILWLLARTGDGGATERAET